MMRSSPQIKNRALLSVTTAVLALLSAPAFAQTPAAEDEEVIVVTGSRIARPDLMSSSPVSVVSAETMKQTNTVTIEQILTSNPQFVAGQTGSSNNPGDGAATVDLRGLGSQRTLVLFDGKRAPSYDTQGSVDVNLVPTALLKRVEVLTGGASAVYGSDAISGVVNFILDDKFTGLRTDASAQVSSRGDAQLYDISLTGGMKLGDRGNIVISGSYSKREKLLFGARPLNANAIDSSDLISSAGSSNTIPTAFDLPGVGRVQVTSTGALTPDVQLYNFTPVNYAQVPLERYSAMALLRYDLTDNMEVYARGNYVHAKVNTNLAPTATAGFFFNIDPSNPFLTAGERAAFFGPDAVINDGSDVGIDPTARAGTSVVGIRRRIVETGGRLSDRVTDAYQIVGGLRGNIGSNLHYDVFAQYGQNKRKEVLKNDLSYSALAQALDVVNSAGGPVCFDRSNGCVPLNLFNVGVIPANQLAFVLRNAQQDTKITQFVTGASLAGDLGFLKSPFAEKPAAFSAGVEYRRETGKTEVDANYASGDLIYYGQGQNIVGKYDVKEGFIELKLPIVQEKPFFYSLGLEGGYRISDYSTAGRTSTWKIGGDWAPVDGLRFRAIYQRAVRAPNLYELYSPLVAGTGSLNVDPCAGTGLSAATIVICRAQGAPAVSIGIIPQPISGQINAFNGGNTKLTAEKSDTFTAGFVFNPPSLRKLSLAVDYYSIRIGNAIDSSPPYVTINQCFVIDKLATSPACKSIVRNALDGSLSGPINVGVPQQLGNIAVLRTNGIDLSASFQNKGDPDGFGYALSINGTYTLSYRKKSDPAAAPIECAGFFGAACNLEPIAKWKHVAELSLRFGKFTSNTRWRYFGPVKQDIGTDILVTRIPGQNYIDQTVSVAVNDKFDLRFGVQNLFDKKSPIVGDTVGNDYTAGSTFPNTYDVIGRTFFAAVSFAF
jgi:iron complex outermembrane recepter protein